MEKIKEISVFFPAYNEEKNIERTILIANKVLKKLADKYEILVIDDGSKDNTGEVVKRLSLKNKKIKLITHKENKGYGSAVRSGFKNCKYEWIVFTDSDGQFDFSELPNFISTQRKTKADLVVGYYKKRRVSFIRKFNSYIWQIIIRILFGLKVKDIDCGFKLIKRNVVKPMNLKSERGAFISTEFLIKAKAENFKIVEIPVTHYPRKEGEATGANFRVIISSFIDLYKLKKKFLIFCFVGGTSALLSLIVFNILFWFGFVFSTSLILGIIFALIYNFLMNRNITFSATGVPIKRQAWRYGVVYFISQSVNFLVSSAMAYLIKGGTLYANIAVITGIVVSIPFSFFGSLLWAFKKPQNRKF
ncbi:hypothetical protein LCGC14_0655890 [marine sediment metagenome]|uniref:Glycosyltransferase 2-like domain-containing protein n=1 Tax=marine sediment metagenome TaxID=412755 RepID=A0A0F9QV15_9ZZZZ